MLEDYKLSQYRWLIDYESCSPCFATDGLPRGLVCSKSLTCFADVSKHPLILVRLDRWIQFIPCLVKLDVFRFERLRLYSCKPLLLVPFTEYPSSPSLYICRWWAGRRRRLDCFESLFWIRAYVDFIFVFMSANLENHASWLVLTVFCISQLEKPFDQDVTHILFCCTQVVRWMTLHLIYAQLLWTTCIFRLLLPCMWAPFILLWLC